MQLADIQADLPGLRDVPDHIARAVRCAAGLAGCPVDHVALCVDSGNLSRYVQQARRKLPDARVSEYCIGAPDSGMRIAEVREPGAGVHLVLAAPTGNRGQLAEFLARTGAEGLQHIAFAVPDAAAAVAELSAQGLCFVGGAVDPARAIVEVREGDSWLRQAFTEPLFGEFFIEVVERRGIVEMRPQNIRSLYDMKAGSESGYPVTA